MTLLADLCAALGTAQVLTGDDMAGYTRDWTGKYAWRPLAVVRPGQTAEVAAVLRLAHAARVPVVPVGGRTGLTGATAAEGALMLSLERMNRIRSINPRTRIAVAEAGVILSALHDAAEASDLYFPLWFGARGSAMVGGALSTNAGGSNVVRYGSTRSLCLGLEVVLADGRVMNLMSALHKDNSGYDLKDLFIGAEGTLGIITAATLRLVPLAAAHATAMLAVPSLDAALSVLNRLQEASGGLVEAFEYMPALYFERLARLRPDLGQPFDGIPAVTVLVELASAAPRDTEPSADGSVPLAALLEGTLASLVDEGLVTDAVVAHTTAQRRALWARREAAAEITFGHGPVVDTDVALPLDRLGSFVARVEAAVLALDPSAQVLSIGHLGDGNLHVSVFPGQAGDAMQEAIGSAIETEAAALGGSFSAEHGIGLSKLDAMRRLKDPVALDVMRAIKAALDPEGILNPGKTVPVPSC